MTCEGAGAGTGGGGPLGAGPFELLRLTYNPRPVPTGPLFTIIVVVGIVLYRIVWADRRERRRQYPKRLK